MSKNLEYLGGGVRLFTTGGRLLGRAFTGWGTGMTAVSPDGREAACTARNSCIVRSLRSRRLPVVRQLTYEGEESCCLLYTPEGRSLLWGGREKAPLIHWDTSDWTPTLLEGFDQTVACLALSPDGRALLVGGWDGAIQVRDVADWSVTAQWQAPPDPGRMNHPPGVRALQASPDSRTLYAGFTGAPYLAAYSLPGFEPAVSFDQAVRTDVALMLPGGALATGDDGADVKLWDPRSGALLARYHTPPEPLVDTGSSAGDVTLLPAPMSEVSCLAVSPDGGTLVVGDVRGRLLVFDVPAGI